MNYPKKIMEKISGYLRQPEHTKEMLLGNCQLNEFPEHLLKCKNIETLILDENFLESCPTQIKNLHNLQIFSCNFNQLEEIPKEIGELPNLTVLHLGWNQITDFPYVIPSLQNLNMANNRLDRLPSAMTECHSLQCLNLRSNRLEYIPQTIQQFTKMETLDLANNKIQHIESTLEQLHKLQNLNLSNNLLETLDIASSTVKSLLLNRNNLHLCSVKGDNLEHIYLEHNKLTAQNVHIDARNLQTLRISHNPLVHFPQMSPCTRLEELYLNNCSLESMCADFPQLKMLNLEYNELQKLPLHSPHLRFLFANNNQITHIENLAICKNLQYCYLRNNSLEKISNEIGNCVQLEELDLSNNKISTLPSTMENLKNLRYLYLENNPIDKQQQQKIRQSLPHTYISF
ncbi:leucine-rich repeat domain-containing protein [Candidatus Uabimicrobium amorphum]|uniref:Uncharacterized protein n=1 Tax=Uabimicrobium amorphum TaxID=2596890 RepID=A0A5S9F5B7_UABAM|nr:leucine-rich repeat domain-containing protein [Candidatus Uabimicrobium amorphum]BBM86432.1 hypothetical protein UABAM_04818 [Candidatus Uabimicrobium amorphum]